MEMPTANRSNIVIPKNAQEVMGSLYHNALAIGLQRKLPAH